MDIWSQCRERAKPALCSGRLTRVVESQEQIATNSLVNTLEEQGLLEEMLEQSKPLRPQETGRLHWLLATPFRYPPLPHGSRFGMSTACGIFYGSANTATALAETAYYRFLFWSGMASAPPTSQLVTQHTTFEALYESARGLKLHQDPFLEFEDELTHPSSYEHTQPLGMAAREHGVEVIEFTSARDPDRGLNVAIFAPLALSSSKPLDPSPWLCETTATQVAFHGPIGNTFHTFPFDSFLVGGRFPHVPPLSE